MLTNVQRSTKVLTVFFSTEMWERYGFYVVQALLALYLAYHLHLSDTVTYALVGSFTALTYISPIIGGWIADKFIGQRKAVLFGAILLCCSYIIMGFATSLNVLLISLAFIATGTGLLKPNVSALLGRQYAVDDPKSNSGFTIFYLGINVGILLGTLLPIQLQSLFGWKVCFLSAAIGAAFAFFVFLFGIRRFNIQEYGYRKHSALFNWSVASGTIILAYVLFYLVLSNPSVANSFFTMVVVIATGIVLRVAQKERGGQRYKTLILLLLFVISVFFWAFYFEMFLVLTLFITRAVEPVILGIHFPAPYYVAAQSFGLIIIGIFLSKLWAKMHYKNIVYATSIKFMLAMVSVVVAYTIILISVKVTPLSALISAWPILVAYLMISLAELLLSPIGLSAVTQLASEKVVSTMMGVFFVSLGIGAFLSGRLADLAAIHHVSESLTQIKIQYVSGFQTLLIVLLGALVITSILCLVIKQLTKRIERA